ncbi:MAG: hypothetical protein K8S13_08755 [Desulfobacula sp.]|uniref:hypothetical protein n=1 Tax=Desulfobacula sp. TaxID=2593537 RepID=UPI0025BE5EA8|nr:hypothetical protein [Desulfobacula sp.]MCD4719937.1 hypothetical protein [Desulfobacula sp.]
MNYFNSMIRLLQFDIAPVKKLSLKQLQYFAIINVVILGLIYGFSAFFFSKILLVEKGFDASSFNALKIIIAGIPIAFLMHASASLFFWVFLKAIGGKANFILSYFNMGAASISLWPLAPFIAALQTGGQMPLMAGLAICFSLYGFAVNVLLIKETFQLSRVKMFIATSVTIIYIGCFLYLWV